MSSELKHFRNLLLLAVTLLSASMPLRATQVLRADFAQISQAAHHVVAGRISSITTQENQQGYLFSTVTLRVAAGEPVSLAGGDYSFQMIGGELNGKSQFISDYPRFAVGDSVVLFLKSSPSTVFGPTTGLWQGVFFVRPTEDGTERVVDHEGRPVLAVRNRQLIRGAVPQGKSAGDPDNADQQGLRVKDFLNEVRKYRAE